MDTKLIEKALLAYDQSLDASTLEGAWEKRRVAEALLKLKTTVTTRELMDAGGDWLGSARCWMQEKFSNGESVTWGSHDVLLGRRITVWDIELLATRVAAAAINEYKR